MRLRKARDLDTVKIWNFVCEDVELILKTFGDI